MTLAIFSNHPEKFTRTPPIEMPGLISVLAENSLLMRYFLRFADYGNHVTVPVCNACVARPPLNCVEFLEIPQEELGIRAESGVHLAKQIGDVRHESTAAEIHIVSTQRFLVLTLGPVALIAVSYWVTFETPHGPREVMAASTPIEWPAPQLRPATGKNGELQDACEKTAVAFLMRMGEEYRVAVESPFVIAGDIPEADLRRHYTSTIEPIVQALRSSYFETPPDQPITLVLLSTVRNFRDTAREMDNYDAVQYHGYFRRDERRIVLDISSGNGTLAHELTHALLAFDFPKAPEWFDEGLASLHEQGVFSDDGRTLVGHHNWRLHSLKQAVLSGQLKPIVELIRSPSFRKEGEGLHYAQVRYLCLYLQRRGLLKEYYRRFRGNVQNDPDGLATLQAVLGVTSPNQIDDDFRIWLRNEFRTLARTEG